MYAVSHSSIASVIAADYNAVICSLNMYYKTFRKDYIKRY